MAMTKYKKQKGTVPPGTKVHKTKLQTIPQMCGEGGGGLSIDLLGVERAPIGPMQTTLSISMATEVRSICI